MRDIFISHADEDAIIALALARGLNAAGYTTWCYEDDSDPGPSYLSQIDEELEATQAVLLIISPSSLSSGQVLKEVVRAHEAGKPFIPLRRDVPHDAVHQNRDWRMALGASVSIAMAADSVDVILPRIIRGLERSGVRPRGDVTAASSPSVAAGNRDSISKALPVNPASFTGAAVVKSFGQRFGTILDRLSESARLGIAIVIGVLGVIGASSNVLKALNPSGAEDYVYRVVPAIRIANVVGNGLGLVLNLFLLYCLWQLYNGLSSVRPRIRLITSLMLIGITVWFVTVAFAIASAPSFRLQAGVKVSVISAAIIAVVLSGVPTLLLRHLYRSRG